MSKYGAIIKEARKQESQLEANREVNLSIKVAESRRRHWVAQAKLQGTTLTAVIIEALSEKFGEP
jgi:hypothetical protein